MMKSATASVKVTVTGMGLAPVGSSVVELMLTAGPVRSMVTIGPSVCAMGLPAVSVTPAAASRRMSVPSVQAVTVTGYVFMAGNTDGENTSGGVTLHW